MLNVRLIVFLLLLIPSALYSQTADDLFARFEQSKGAQRIEAANSLFEELYAQELTDSIIWFDRSVKADSVNAMVYFWMGELKFEESDFGKAIGLFEQAEKLIGQQQLLLLGDCLSDLAISYARAGQFSNGIATAARAVAIDEQLADKSRLLITLNTLGSIYIMAKQPDDGEKYVRRSLELAVELNDSVKMAARTATLGEVCQMAGRYNEAYNYAYKAFRLDSLRNDRMRMAIRQTQMANALMKMGQLEPASMLLNDARPVLQAAGNIVSLAICLNQQGYVALMQERWREAVDYYRQAYHIYVRTGDRNSKLTSLWGLWHAYGHLDAAKALAYMEDYTALRDSIYQDNVTRVTADYNARYENDELKRQNEQAQHDNRILMIGGIATLGLLLTIMGMLIYALRLKSRTARMQQQLRMARDRFFTNITHELRTPLTVINSATDMLMQHAEERDDDDDRQLTHNVKRHSSTLLELINQMLDIARLNNVSDVDQKQWRNGDVTEFVSVMRESYEAYARSRSVRLRYEPESTGVMMDFIEDYMRKILRNLLSNAVKFTGEGSTVTIVTRTKGEWLLLSVSDEGPGLTDDELAHIFEPFYRASSGSQQQGTGIGLPLVKLCVEAMQGSISAESTPGQGTCFTVALPLHHEGAAALSMETGEMLPDEVTLPYVTTLPDDEEADGEHSTGLLIVEDAPEVALYMGRLMPADYSVAYAGNGNEALEKARQLMPDLIVTDVMMPGMDGLELCRQVRSDSLLCHIPVIMVTAKASPEDRLAGLQAGADAYMEKPFSSDELSVRIKTLLQQRQMLQQRYRQMGSQPVVEEEATDDLQGAELMQPLREQDIRFLKQVDELLRKQFQTYDVNLELIASELCITRLQLNRKMKALLGESMRDHVNRVRTELACKLLSEGNMNISEVARTCGIDDVAYFSRFFRKMTGKSPSEYKNQTY